MSDQEKATDALEKIMVMTRKPLRDLYNIFRCQAKISLIIQLPDMPGALIMNASPKQAVDPEELIKAIRETQAFKDKISGVQKL